MVYTLDAPVISAMDTARRDRFRREVLANDGGTQTVDGGKAPVSGFMVSVAKAEKIIPLWLFQSHGCEVLRKFERANDGLLTRPGAYLGAWVSEATDDDGKTYDAVYLDVSYHFADEGLARLQGEQEKQIAIFDLANLCEITL